MRVLIDSGFLVALARSDDHNHADAVVAMELYLGPYVVHEATLVEAYHHIQRHGKNYDGAVKFLYEVYHSEGIFKGRTLEIQNLTDADRTRLLAIMAQYRVDYVDAVIMALSERLHINSVMTFDVADFGKFVKQNGDYLRIIPAYG